ncbi:MAG: hypothetical protein MUF15_16405, partial [Acidobacteria bacterium]|nr:hypothetical protein [Acidobacteriota bacterium]
MLSFTWFDDKTAYRFFRDGGKEEIPNVPLKTGYVKPYSVNPDISGFEQRKKRIKVLSSVYGNEYAQRLLYFHLALDCFLRLKMPINRLYLLLNETYFYFERYLYAKVNWDEGKPGYYRDHSLHAANEAYLGHKLLKNLEPKFIDFFNQNNDITCYINENCKIGRSSERLQQVIYRTWFIAALFHDLGYVLGFKKEVREKMLRFHRYSDLIARDGR